MPADPALSLKVVWEFGADSGDDAPPSGFLFLIDPDAAPLTDADGSPLMEAM